MSALTASMREALAEVEGTEQDERVEHLRRLNQIPVEARGTEPPERQPWGPGGGAALERFRRPWSFDFETFQTEDTRPIVKCAEGCGRMLRQGVRCDCLPPFDSDHWFDFSNLIQKVTFNYTYMPAGGWSMWFAPIDPPKVEIVEPVTDDWYEREARRRDDKGVTLGDFTLDLPYVSDRPMLAKPTGLSDRTKECLRQRGALPAPAKPWVEREQRRLA